MGARRAAGSLPPPPPPPHTHPVFSPCPSDTRADTRALSQVDAARGQEVADAHAFKFYETSAKDGTNVKESFAALAREVVESMIANGTLVPPGGAGGGGGGGGGGAAAGAAAAGGEKKKDCAVA